MSPKSCTESWKATILSGSLREAPEAAREWRDGLLIVVGGDGTISEVVNGLGRAGFPEGVTLAILPAGTGNDLAETLAIPDDPEEAEAVLRQNRVRTLDVVRVRSEGIGEQFFINVATGGMGAEISGLADGEMKKRWGNWRTCGVQFAGDLPGVPGFEALLAPA
jgi:diacylglycerol kinase (ATP)